MSVTAAAAVRYYSFCTYLYGPDFDERGQPSSSAIESSLNFESSKIAHRPVHYCTAPRGELLLSERSFFKVYNKVFFIFFLFRNLTKVFTGVISKQEELQTYLTRPFDPSAAHAKDTPGKLPAG